MTQIELTTFLAVVKYGSISLAAEKLFISQPALSRRIRTLENELGCTLIRRQQGKKSLELTAEGQEFISIAERWLDVWRAASSIKSRTYTPEFTVILNTSMGEHVPLAIDDFIRQATGIRFKFHIYHSLEAYQWMECGKADLALISKPFNNSLVNTIPAYKENMILLARGIYEGIQTIRPRQLDVSQELFVPWSPDFQDWHDFWFGSGASPKIFGDSPPTMKHFWKTENRWWSVVPASFTGELLAHDGVRKINLIDAPGELVLYYLVKKNEHSDIAEMFLKCLDLRAREVSGIVSCMDS